MASVQSTPRPDAGQPELEGPNAPEAADPAGPGAISVEANLSGTGLWADQRGPGSAAVPPARVGTQPSDVAVRLRRPQPAEAV